VRSTRSVIVAVAAEAMTTSTTLGATESAPEQLVRAHPAARRHAQTLPRPRAYVPLMGMLCYERSLRSITNGLGSYLMSFSHSLRYQARVVRMISGQLSVDDANARASLTVFR
jgi:translation elongation factor EF-G